MTNAEAQAKTIDGRARTVRELLDKAKYAIGWQDWVRLAVIPLRREAKTPVA